MLRLPPATAMFAGMEKTTGKRIAKVSTTLTKRTIEALEPAAKSWIAWDNKLIGFGCRVQPSGTKAFIVNYRAGAGGRKAPNKRIVIGRYGRMTPSNARRMAQELLGRVAAGDDPASERVKARDMPTLADAFEDYMAANPNRADSTVQNYRKGTRLHLNDWLSRPLNAISRRDIEERFNLITRKHGGISANQTFSMLRSVYRRPCIDHDSLRNPVELWLAGGGQYNPKRRRRISAPAEVLPCWCAGLEAANLKPIYRDIFLTGLYTGMRLGEVVSLRWERVDLKALTLRVDETKTGEPLELPITRQLAAVFMRRQENSGDPDAPSEGWIFPSSANPTGHVAQFKQYYDKISEEGGARFWFHALRNCFITVAERELMLPRSLTKRLVNHARPNDVTEGYAADWSIGQLREPAQRVADRIDELANSETLAPHSGKPEDASSKQSRQDTALQ